jgi:hypothetical protein
MAIAPARPVLQIFDDVYNPDLIYHNISPTVHVMHTFDGDGIDDWAVHYRANQTTLPITPTGGALIVHQARALWESGLDLP